MKTIHDIKQEVAMIQRDYPEKPTGKDELKRYNKAADRMRFLWEMQIYLETNPTEEFVRSEIKRLDDKIDKINESYPNWKSTNNAQPKGEGDEKIWLAKYHKEMDVLSIKKQLKTLRFVIS